MGKFPANLTSGVESWSGFGFDSDGTSYSSSSSDSMACRDGAVSARGSTFIVVEYVSVIR